MVLGQEEKAHVLGRIEPYTTRHEDRVVALFYSIQKESSGIYPPKKLLDHYYSPGKQGIQKWLASGEDVHRYVFVSQEGGEIVGHIEVAPLRDGLTDEQAGYWREAFLAQPSFVKEGLALSDLAVIKRLGVLPSWQGRDIGRQLLRYALQQIITTQRLIPSLVVIEGLHAARTLYESEGARQVGCFAEATGEQMVSYVF